VKINVEFIPASQVWNIRPLHWEKAVENEMSRRIYRILLKWIPFGNQQYEDWDGRQNCGYFFGGSFWYSSDTAFMAAIWAVLSKVGEYDESVSGIPRIILQERAIRALRYIGFTHDTGAVDCVRVKGVLPYTSGKKWGGQGDSFFMSSQNGKTIANIGYTVWLLWDDLDDETKLLMQNVIASYADRWCDDEPRNGVYYDTQCEENGWTAAGIAAGLALFPEHPHHEDWKAGFEKWTINTITTYKDRLADPSGLIDAAPGNRVKTVTFHPDYTTENHAFVHPSYLCAGINLRIYHAILSLMGNQEVLPCSLHNNEMLYENTVKRWAQFDGLAVPVQGQDWWYNRQHERQETHAMLNVLHHNADAARFERAAFDSIERLQQSNTKGCLLEENGEECVINREHAQFAKDLEHISAVDLTKTYLLHLFGGVGAPPSDPGEMAARLAGVYNYPFGNTIVHRTASTFTSFSWRNNVMALTLPQKGVWSITPLYSSYTGTLRLKNLQSDRKLSNETIIRDVEKQNVVPFEDGFSAVVTIARGDRQLLQDVAFIALPNGSSVYIEQFHALKQCCMEEAATGIVGIRNENYTAMPDLAPGRRAVYFNGAPEVFEGFYGRQPNGIKTYPPQNHINVDHQIGYLLYGSAGVRYVNKHEYPKWKGVEDILIMNDLGNAEWIEGQSHAPFMLVSMPNQSAAETAEAWETSVLMDCDGERVYLLETGGYLIYANFSDRQQTVTGEHLVRSSSRQLYDGTNRLDRGHVEWTSNIRAYSGGYLASRCSVETEQSDTLFLEAYVLAETLILHNLSDNSSCFRLRRLIIGDVITVELKAREYQTLHL